MKTIVRVGEAALMTMLLNGIEAFDVRHLVKTRKLRGVETYGTLWGYESRPAGGGCRLLNVGFVSIDTSARRTTRLVDNDVEALRLKQTLITGFWPHYEYLGDFHTHPFAKATHREVIANRWHDFSRSDRDSIEYFINECRLNYRVGLVLTIVAMKRAGGRRPQAIDDATIEFSLNRYRLWLRAIAARKPRPGGVTVAYETVHLDCPGILGMRHTGKIG